MYKNNTKYRLNARQSCNNDSRQQTAYNKKQKSGSTAHTTTHGMNILDFILYRYLRLIDIKLPL